MSTTEDDSEPFAHSEDDDPGSDLDSDSLFGSYSVRAPGVHIVLDGRPVSAPATD